MAGLSIRAKGGKKTTVLAEWSKRTPITPPDGCTATDSHGTRFYAFRSDGKLLSRTSRVTYWRYAETGPFDRHADSGHWTVVRSWTPEQRVKLETDLLRNGYTRTA